MDDRGADGVALATVSCFVLPIGGADMRFVISLLERVHGLGRLGDRLRARIDVLIVAGMLVGASGTLLTMLMAKAMNRSIANVLFGAFGQVQAGTGQARADDGRTVTRTTAEDVAVQLSYAARSSSCRATAWPSPRRSTTCAQLAELLEHRASTSCTRSIRSPAACQVT